MAAPTEKFTAEQVINAIKTSRGILSSAADSLGCHRRTVDRYVAKYPTVREEYEEANERVIDFAESRLLKNINDGDTASIIFFLKTRGKRRGYVERQEVTGKDGDPIEQRVIHDFSQLSLDEMIALRSMVGKVSIETSKPD